MSETKHTPTPWRVDGSPNAQNQFAIVARCEDYSEITQGDAYYEREKPICYFPSLVDPKANTYHNDLKEVANAAFIVRAVNAHEAMVGALSYAIAPFEAEGPHVPVWVLIARAALAKAKD